MKISHRLALAGVAAVIAGAVAPVAAAGTAAAATPVHIHHHGNGYGAPGGGPAGSRPIQSTPPGGQGRPSPGTLGANLIKVPVHIPVNVCGNTPGGEVLSPVFGNHCATS